MTEIAHRPGAGRGFSWSTLAACLWLGLFPQLHFGTYSSITLDKWICMFLLLFFTVICILKDGAGHHLSCPPKLSYLLAGCLIGWMGVSCLLSTYPAAVWWVGASARREGLQTQLCYILLFFCFSSTRVDPLPVCVSSALGVLMFAVVTLLQRAGYNPFGLYPTGLSYATNPEFQGPIGNIDMGTGYLCLLSGFFVSILSDLFFSGKMSALLSTKKTRLMLLSGIGGLCTSVFLLITMGVQFGMLSLAAILLLALLDRLPRRSRILLLLLLLVCALLLAWFWPGTSGGFWEFHEMLHGRPQPTFGSNRLAVWKYSLGLALENPLFGGGSDTFEPRFNSWLQQQELSIPTERDGEILPAYFDNPHNEYLALLLNHGLPAVLLFIALLLTALFHPRFRQSPFRLAIFAYAVQAFFSFSVCLVAPIFWVLLGLCCSGYPINSSEKHRT